MVLAVVQAYIAVILSTLYYFLEIVDGKTADCFLV